MRVQGQKRGDIMRKFKIISDGYYSNCMIEAIRAKIHNPRIKLYFCKPRMAGNGRFQMFHFMWSDGIADYDFSDLNDEEIPWYKSFIFKGHLRRFEKGFAKRYSIYRNNLW